MNDEKIINDVAHGIAITKHNVALLMLSYFFNY